MKHEDILRQMTLEEKAAFLSGKSMWESRNIDRLGIMSIFCSDGPHGLRKQTGSGDHLGINESQKATCFPTAATIANSWDVSLGEKIGEAIGAEAAVQGVNVVLGPGLNIKRSPLCGRNFEYFSEDPYLSGKMAAAYIKGIQSQGVFACPKHFAVNSQELRRMAMNSVLDERTLRELYLEGFEIAVKEGHAKAIMTSYNQVNGEYANENKHLLKDILRGEWNFDGIVITDWGGSNDHVAGVVAGSNLEMPNPGFDSAREILRALQDGSLRMEELDECVDAMLEAAISLSSKKNKSKNFDWQTHHELAKKAAAESIVMLKNDEKLLPLAPDCKVALIGDFAITPRYQGAGSSMVNSTIVETMRDVIGNCELTTIGCSQGYVRSGDESAALVKEALELAAKADVILYCFGLDEISEAEGMDRNHMRIPQNQINLLEALVKVNSNIVGVISSGSSIEMPWHYCCKSILHGYLGGQAGAGAMMDVITGKVNPSGRLGESYPIKYEDTPAFHYFPSMEKNAEYRESLYIGYRYYETSQVRIQYPFGYGLSYTEFEYENLVVEADKVICTIRNIGQCDGAEVVQLYVSGPGDRIFRPEKELKGFAKVFLKAGEEKTIHLSFDDKTFRYWNQKTGKWEVEGGCYQISVGANVRDIRLFGEISKDSTTDQYPYDPQGMPAYYSGMIQKVQNKEFEALLGKPIPDGKWSGKLEINDAICQMYYAKSGLARLIYNILTRLKTRSEEKGKPDLNILFIYNMPFRALAKMTNGAINIEMVNGILLLVNGHFFKGSGKVIKEFFKNRKANRTYKKYLVHGQSGGLI